MDWTNYISELKQNRPIKFKYGNLSVEILPIREPPKKGDVILCKVNGDHFLDTVSTIRNSYYQISNRKNHMIGWTTIDKIYGIVVG